MAGDKEKMKIGVARNPWARCSGLSHQAGDAGMYLLAVVEYGILDPAGLTAREVEQAIHRYLQQYRIHGEWFKVGSAIVERTLDRIMDIPQDRNEEAGEWDYEEEIDRLRDLYDVVSRPVRIPKGFLMGGQSKRKMRRRARRPFLRTERSVLDYSRAIDRCIADLAEAA